MGRVFIKTMGCKVNLSDTHALVNRMGILPNALKHEADEQIIKSQREGQRFPVELKPVELNKQGHFKTSHTLFGEMKSEKSRAFITNVG
jgi:hypothetical protein